MHQQYFIAQGCQRLARLRLTRAHFAPRWLFAYTVLILALGMGSRYQPAFAQDVPPTQPVIISYFLDLGTPRTSICVGETVTYPVRVRARVLVPGHPDAGLPRVLGAALTATTDNTILRNVTPPENYVSITRPDTSLWLEEPLSMTFSFTGVAPGRTFIDFEGEVTMLPNLYPASNTFPLSYDFAVRVVPCNFKVVTISRWTQVLIGGTVKATAIIYDGHMRGDEEGYYAGEADVVWLVAASIPGCGYSNRLSVSKVTMRGRLDMDNQLHVDLTFPTVTGSELIPCPGGFGGGDIGFTARSLHLTLPVYGGVVTPAQVLSNPAGDVTGRANVYITIEASE
jgi:hypothetical protein